MSKKDNHQEYTLAGYFIYRDNEYWTTTRSTYSKYFYKPPKYELIPIYTKTKPR
jgi:hypothetical protein